MHDCHVVAALLSASESVKSFRTRSSRGEGVYASRVLRGVRASLCPPDILRDPVGVKAQVIFGRDAAIRIGDISPGKGLPAGLQRGILIWLWFL